MPIHTSHNDVQLIIGMWGIQMTPRAIYKDTMAMKHTHMWQSDGWGLEIDDDGLDSYNHELVVSSFLDLHVVNDHYGYVFVGDLSTLTKFVSENSDPDDVQYITEYTCPYVGPCPQQQQHEYQLQYVFDANYGVDESTQTFADRLNIVLSWDNTIDVGQNIMTATSKSYRDLCLFMFGIARDENRGIDGHVLQYDCIVCLDNTDRLNTD